MHKLDNASLLGILYLPVMLLLYKFLPEAAGAENGPIENFQLVWLFLGVCYCYHYPKRLATTSKERNIWLAGALGFCLLIMREISWGFVFFYHPDGTMYDSSEFAYLTEIIHGGTALLILYTAYLLHQGHFFRFLRAVHVPSLIIYLLLLYAFLARVAEEELYPYWTGELGEELAELGCYMLVYWAVRVVGDKRKDIPDAL